MDAKDEEKYWREHHEKQTSVKPDHTYEHYAPAYKTGYEGFLKYPDKEFEDVEAGLAVEYKKHKAALPWDDGRDAARFSWDRLSGVITPRDVDRGVRYD